MDREFKGCWLLVQKGQKVKESEKRSIKVIKRVSLGAGSRVGAKWDGSGQRRTETNGISDSTDM